MATFSCSGDCKHCCIAWRLGLSKEWIKGSVFNLFGISPSLLPMKHHSKKKAFVLLQSPSKTTRSPVALNTPEYTANIDSKTCVNPLGFLSIRPNTSELLSTNPGYLICKQ